MRARQRRSRAASALVVLALGATAFAVAGCGSDSADLPDGTVARVGDAPITQTQLSRSVAQTIKAYESQGQAAPAKDSDEFAQVEQQAMQTLVQQQVVVSEAAVCGTPCTVSADDVTAELANVVATEFSDSQKEFNAFLKERGMTHADARGIVRNSLLQQKLFDHVTRGVRFDTAAAKAYYEANPDGFRTAAGRKASHILVATKAEAERIRAEVTPANFARIARAQSTDTGSAAQGGDLGTVQKGQMVPEFEKAVFALGDGQISQPIKTQFGWHIIMVHMVPASTTPFSEARAGIISSQLQEKRQAAYSEWAESAVKEWEGRTVYANEALRPPAQTSPAPTDLPPAEGSAP